MPDAAGGAPVPAPPPITNRRVLRIAIPIILSNVTVPVLGAVDTGVVGQMGLAAPIGAVGIGAVTLAAFYWVFGFLRMGTTGLVAQARGARDEAETGAILTRALAIGLGAGLAIVIGQAALIWAAFQVAPASAEVEGLARAYLGIRIWGAPAAIALYAVNGWLIATERTGSVLALQLWMNGLNIALDIWFVLGLGWGVEGVAVATLIAEWSGLALGLVLCRPAFSGDQWRDRARVLDPVRIRRMLAVNGDILIRSVLLQGVFVSFLFLGAGLGDVTLAANQVLIQFLEITAFALDGFAFSAEALVGAGVGARHRATVRRAASLSAQWAAGGALVLGAAFWLAGPALIDLMTTSEPVREAARAYLPWVAAAPVLGVASWMLDGIFIGATRTGPMRRAMIEATTIYAIAAAVLLPSFGNHGLWAALSISFLARAATLGLRYPALERSVT